MTLSSVATGPDLLRLVAIPIFAWIAIRDVKTRRISSGVWIPLAALGALLLVWDGWLAWRAGGDAFAHDFLLPAAVSLGVVVPLAYLFWWVGGFGGADAKALFVLAILFPTTPRYVAAGLELPLTASPIGAFSLTILTNAVVVGIAIPLALAAWNAAHGRLRLAMFIGHPIGWKRVGRTHGILLEKTDGVSSGGLDLDALRMYLRWRGLTLSELRDDPDRYRDPSTLPDEPNPPTDGAVAAGADVVGTTERSTDGDATRPSVDGGSMSTTESVTPDRSADDPWGAAAFLENIDGTAYGTAPDTLRDGLEVLTSEDAVWISPGTPFLLPVFLGLLVAFAYGDLLFGLLF